MTKLTDSDGYECCHYHELKGQIKIDLPKTRKWRISQKDDGGITVVVHTGKEVK